MFKRYKIKRCQGSVKVIFYTGFEFGVNEISGFSQLMSFIFSLRQENLKKAKAFLRAGNVSQANDFFQRCVEITPMMATEVIQVCTFVYHSMNIAIHHENNVNKQDKKHQPL